MKTFEQRLGQATIRIMPAGDGFRGTVLRHGRTGDVLEDSDRDRLLARLRNEAGKLHPDYFGFEGAIGRFKTYFPEGFRDARFIEMERSYKLAARERLVAGAPLERVLAGDEFQIGAVAKAFQTNMLSVFEAARVSQLLCGEGGTKFVEGAAAFTVGDRERGLRTMIKAVEPFGRASWPMVTYLPFMWRPDAHMYLKPEKTADFATRVGHPFAAEYQAEPSADVYSSLLDLASVTEANVASLGPSDRIDVQSFIWVVGDYGDAELAESD